MPSKNTICIWYDGAALEAARFYAETFPDSAVKAVHRAPGDYPSGKQGDVLTVDHTELEEADWFSRAEVAAAMAGDEDGRFIAPPPQAIAHHLLKWWLEQ